MIGTLKKRADVLNMREPAGTGQVYPTREFFLKLSMRPSHYLKNMLFESFYPSFCFTSWSTSLSMSCEVNQKSEKKSFKKSNSSNSEMVS